ncbi:MAG: hypothetical protein UIC45_03615 [Paludibacteraceae bacterium]|nr:hypothetical protein [Paludibacteraceae bacterium]
MYIPDLKTLMRVIKSLRRYPSPPSMPTCDDPIVEVIRSSETKHPKGSRVFY